MTFPSGTTISTANVDSPNGDPSLARQDILQAFQALNQLIASENQALGILVLESNGRINSTYLPANLQVQGSLALQPSTGVVNIRNVLRLNQINVDDIDIALGFQNPTAGDICYLVNGDAGKPCLAVFDGTEFRVVRLSTSVGAVGAALSATATLTATADV
jgi:hypothetical protein